MPILVQCPNPACRVNCSVAEGLSGPVKCPKCGKPFAVKQTFDGQKSDTKKSRPSANANPFPVLPAEFGRYRVLRLLGQGGMGAVYLAEDSQLGRQVALKMPFLNASESSQRVERFVREARSAAVLQHPNICTVFDAGQIDGRPFITMAYVAGTPLEDEIDPDVPMPQRRAAEIVRKVALALEHAHGKGTVHRDLKPANVMLAADGEPVVMDFGLAKRLETNGTNLTRLGGIVGTPSYMSPEQVNGEAQAIGPATDIYSLGVMLFEMLTGNTPYTGTTTVVMGQILSAPVPPVKEFRPDVDPQLDAICRKAMAKAPADRFPSMAEFANALDQYLKAPQSSPPPIPVPPAVPVPQAPSPGVDHSPFDDLVDEPTPAQASKKAKKGRAAVKPALAVWWRHPAVLAGFAVALIALGALWAGSVFKVKTKDGLLVVEVTEPNAEVYVDGERVTVRWDKGGKKAEFRIKPGTRKVEVKKDGFTLFGEEVEVKDCERRVFVARLDRIVPKPEVANLPPVPPTDVKPKPDINKPPASPADDVKPKPEVAKLPPLPAEGFKALFTNSVGMEFVFIKPGTFEMGSPGTEYKRSEDERRHRVTLTKGFHLQTTLVTQKQWKAVMGNDNNPSHFKGDDLPVEMVRWDDAKEFCQKLGLKEGRAYRLPYEVEWEYAARAGTTTPFWQGTTITTDQVNFDGNSPYRATDPEAASRRRTTPVKQFKPNPWGLYDAGGNLWQWCEDWYGDYPNGPSEDPKKTNSGTSRVLRGGSWMSVAASCRAAHRHAFAPGDCYDHLGFRVCFRLD